MKKIVALLLIAVLLFANFCDVAGALGIDSANLGNVFFLFRQIYGGPGGAVDHGIRLYSLQNRFHAGTVGNIHRKIGGGGTVLRRNVTADYIMIATEQLIDHIVTQLTTHTGNQNFHHRNPLSLGN